MTLKQSKLGTRFFAHVATGGCSTAPEQEAHLRLKAIAVAAARALGWVAETEATGTTPAGDAWRADVLARRGKNAVAVEIQWSSQPDGEIMRRQKRYRDAGVRGLWLLRHPGFPITQDLPAVIVSGTPQAGFTVRLPGSEEQELPVDEFLAAAFSGRFRFGLPLGAWATIDILGGPAQCWHDRCQAVTTAIAQLDVRFGSQRCAIGLAELGEHRRLLSEVLGQLPADLGLGQIKPRYSLTQRRRYVSNGCCRCDRLFGEFLLPDLLLDQRTLCSIPIRITADWHTAITSQVSYEASWGVYGEPPEPAGQPSGMSNRLSTRPR